MIIGLDTTCNADVFPKGFDIDASGNIAMAGYTNAGSNTSCPVLTNSQSGMVGFLSYQDPNGKLDSQLKVVGVY